MRDAESQSYEALLVPLEEPSEEVLTSQEVAIAKNFKLGLAMALVLSIMAFLIEKI
jgi:hypothetical protein